MKTALTMQKQNVVELDGFNDFTTESEGDDAINTSSRVIQGTKLKYLDPRWLIEERDVTGMLLTAIGVVNVANKWDDNNKPLITRILAPGEKFPDFDKLNAECPRSEWRTAFGKEVGPWSGQHCLYLIDENLNRYTWPSPTTTIGSAIAVRELVDQIKLARKFRGENVYPVIELNHTYFRTGYGDRERPHLPVQRWVTLGPDRAGALPTPDTPVLSAGAPADARTVAPPSTQEVLNDKILY
jgi:hypothetical protein